MFSYIKSLSLMITPELEYIPFTVIRTFQYTELRVGSLKLPNKK